MVFFSFLNELKYSAYQGNSSSLKSKPLLEVAQAEARHRLRNPPAKEQHGQEHQGLRMGYVWATDLMSSLDGYPKMGCLKHPTLAETKNVEAFNSWSLEVEYFVSSLSSHINMSCVCWSLGPIFLNTSWTANRTQPLHQFLLPWDRITKDFLQLLSTRNSPAKEKHKMFHKEITTTGNTKKENHIKHCQTSVSPGKTMLFLGVSLLSCLWQII